MPSVFDQAFRITVGEEGGMSLVRSDRGNWTGGAVGRGELRGSCFGISAASYPDLDVGNLTLDAAKVIYHRDFWTHLYGDALPAPLAVLAFDGAVNSGPSRSVRWMQGALGVATDGVIGPRTLAAAEEHHGRGAAVLARYQAARMRFLTSLPVWALNPGWSSRLCTVLLAAAQVQA